MGAEGASTGGFGGASGARPGHAPPRLAAPPALRHIRPRMSERIAITVNGEDREIAPGDTVAALLAAIGLDTRKVAVERNEEVRV